MVFEPRAHHVATDPVIVPALTSACAPAIPRGFQPARCEEPAPSNPASEPAPPETQRAPEPPKSATAVKERPSPPKVDQLPPFKVLLHNDDVNEMGYVVRTLMELTPLGKVRSTEVTLEADSRGVALVLVTHKERAELYQQQFKSKMLTVTIEPA